MSADLKALKALALAATPGPWERDTIRSEGEYGSDDDGGYGFDSYEVTDDKGRCIMDCLNNDGGAVHVGHDGHAWDDVAKRNAAFVAAANPVVILALIERLEAAEAAPLPAEQPSNPVPMTDSDGERHRFEQRRDYSEYVRRCPEHNIQPMPFDEYKIKHDALTDERMTIEARIVGQQTKGGGNG